MTLTQNIGDTKTHSIPLRWNRRPFVPSGGFNLIFTVKDDPATQLDAAAKFQKQLGAGIEVTGNLARVGIIPINTTTLTPNTYYWDIQAQNLSDPKDVRSVANGTLTLIRDVTRLTGASIDIYTTSPVDLFPFLEIDGGSPTSDYAGVAALDEGAP